MLFNMLEIIKIPHENVTTFISYVYFTDLGDRFSISKFGNVLMAVIKF